MARGVHVCWLKNCGTVPSSPLGSPARSLQYAVLVPSDPGALVCPRGRGGGGGRRGGGGGKTERATDRERHRKRERAGKSAGHSPTHLGCAPQTVGARGH